MEKPEDYNNIDVFTELDSIAGKAKPIRRQEQIAEYVLRHGSATIKGLTEMFDVSLMTVHRDLDELERQGVLRKFRGHVTAQPSSLFESNVRYRLATGRAEKEALAQFALKQIESGQSVMLDDSTTALALAKLLPNKAPITIVTNFMMMLNELSGEKGITLISLGGEYVPSHDSFNGVVCEAAIASVRADILFVSVSAVSNCIAFHQEQEIVRIKRAMMASARRCVLLVDNSKFGKVALHQLAPLRDFDLVVVDAGVSETHLNELRECSVPFEVVPL